MSIKRIDYCQFILTSQTNFTMTNFADHGQGFSHDAVKRYLQGDKLSASLVWEHAQREIVPSPRGCIVFDDTILDKGHSHQIELVRRQYSGNAHGIIKGIGLVNCLYVNPDTGEYWPIDYRLFAPEQDGKTKLEHVRDMLVSAAGNKALPFTRVLFDTWYATMELMLLVDSLGRRFYCPIKANRLVDDSAGQTPYRAVSGLCWTAQEAERGKLIKIKGFPRDYKVKLFRVTVSSHRTDWIVTNDLAQDSTQGTQEACALRWKIEQFHRELKQLTGVEKCQCRKARMQRNHIACAILVWLRLRAVAKEKLSSMYQIKTSWLSERMRQELRSPSVLMRFA
ncbi:MAG: transposase [Roseateles sp.]|uniref:IS701 family transposase n=1 Tax=Roseateles sp. TaxID=1971397 RepID=UPI0039EB9188